jgi:palmitoyltransferase ZDHHC9/14/18
VTTYNVQILAGTAIHTPTKYLEKHHKNVLHGSLEDLVKTPPATPPPRRRSVKRTTEEIKDPAEAQLATEVAQAAQRRRSSRVDLRKEAIRNLTAAGEAVAQKGPELLSSVKDSVQNVLRGSFGKSKGKSAATRAQDAGSENHEENAAEDEEEKEYLKPKVKQWEKQGLYVGQHRDFKPNLKESKNRKNRRRADTGERQYLPLPMFAGERMLNVDYMRDWRDFKLPFDVYSPLPKKIKVDGWVQLRKSKCCNAHRFVLW